MASIRVTPRLMAQRMLSNLQSQSRRLLVLQEQLSTGLKVNSPSQGPLDARRAISARGSIAAIEQYLTNISNVGPQLEETSTTIQTTLDVFHRARELTLQGGNGTNSQSNRIEIAEEVNQLLESVVSQANHQSNGRYIFGGSRTLNTPFSVTRAANGDITAVTYEGNDEETVNETGFDAFLSQQDVFQTLIDIRDNLLAGNLDDLQNARLTELDAVQDQLLQSTARVGAVQNRLERLSSDHEDFVLQLRTVLSDSIDADYAETIVNLNSETNAFEAALNATSRVIQPSLLDFL